MVSMDVSVTGRLPNLVIAGVAKAGTTSLFHYLGQHREICPSDIKELRYFSPLQYGEDAGSVVDYAQHFQHCDGQRYALEATPGYFYGGRLLARGLHTVLPSARVILILRNPEDRCLSFFRFIKSKVRIPRQMTFTEYLDRCLEMRQEGTDMDRDNGDYSGLVKGCYHRWLSDWTDEFGEDLKIVFFDDLVKDTAGCLRGLFQWLDLDADSVTGLDLNADNETVAYRMAVFQRWALALNRRNQRFFEGHQRLKRTLRKGYYLVNRAQGSDAISSRDKERLSRFYADHNEKLASQLSSVGLELPEGWSPQRYAAE